MTKDLNKGITNISYNLLNLPQQVDILSPLAEARNAYSYSADGEKLRVVKKYNSNFNTSPIIGSAVNVSSMDVTKTTDYVDGKIFENNTLDRILVDGGYIKGDVYYFYETDHLGDNRTVVNQSGTVVERSDYYPYGMQMAHNQMLNQASGSDNKRKFSGKELDVMHGLNLYDFSARSHDPTLGRFTTVDPLAEKYYSISPYAYCAGNPVTNVDPSGEDYWSTNDPEQIRAFLNTLGSGGTQFDFSKGWNHATDAEFASNLSYNDESGKYYMSYGTVENGEVTINSKSFDANITPSGQIYEKYQHSTIIPGLTYTNRRLTPYGEMVTAEMREELNFAVKSLTPTGRAIATIANILSLSEQAGLFKYKKGDNINLERFVSKGKKGALVDPKSKEYIEPDRGRNSGIGGHGGSYWKLYSKDRNRIGTISKEGIWLRH